MSKQRRQQLVRQLESASAIRSPAVRQAFLEVPRESFIPDVAERLGVAAVYRDEAYPTKTDPRGDAIGTVALAEARARWTDNLGQVSDLEGQFGERIGKPGGRRHVSPEVVEAPAEVLDEGVRRDDDPGGAVAL